MVTVSSDIYANCRVSSGQDMKLSLVRQTRRNWGVDPVPPERSALPWAFSDAEWTALSEPVAYPCGHERDSLKLSLDEFAQLLGSRKVGLNWKASVWGVLIDSLRKIC